VIVIVVARWLSGGDDRSTPYRNQQVTKNTLATKVALITGGFDTPSATQPPTITLEQMILAIRFY
jgi:hypothetical protein